MTGRAMISGAVPYIDFFDIKGPVLFLIQALGQWIYPGKLGTLLVQLPFLLAFVFLSYRTALMFVSERKALICTLCVFYLIHSTFESGNLTEEYCIPMIALFYEQECGI